MDTAEIRKIASLCKSEFVNEAYVGSHALGAIGRFGCIVAYQARPYIEIRRRLT